MKLLNVKVIGDTPLMLKNPQLACPSNEYGKILKGLNSKRKKTDDDYEEIRRVSFLGGLYMDGDKYILPSNQIEAALIDAAREHKLGKKFEMSVGVVDMNIKLRFPLENLTPEELYKEGSCVDVRMAVNKVMGEAKQIEACRPCLHDWSCEFTLWYDESQVNYDSIVEAFEVGGRRYGTGTYRKGRFGRFSATIENKD